MSNGTFLGLSALRELYLSHNQIERIESGYFYSLNELEILRLDNNHIHWINGDILTALPKLKVLTLHSNHLASLQLELVTHPVVMHLVTIHDNRWQCSSKNDCTWITQTVDTLNKSAVKYLNQVNVRQPINFKTLFFKSEITNFFSLQVTCSNADEQSQKLISFASSCRNLEMLPVSAQKATSPILVIVISVAVVILLLVSVIIGTFIAQKLIRRGSSRHLGTTYLHYSMSDDQYVRQQVGSVVAKVTTNVCYHHGDLSTQLSVGQAIQSAVTRSQCLVIVATPGYIDSAITSTELHILADCILQKCSFYPVVVLAAQHSAYSLHQVKHYCNNSNYTVQST